MLLLVIAGGAAIVFAVGATILWLVREAPPEAVSQQWLAEHRRAGDV